MQRHFPIIVEQDEDNVFIVSCSVFKGCHSYGDTLFTAMENIKEVILLCLEDEEQSLVQQNYFIGIRDLDIALINSTECQQF